MSTDLLILISLLLPLAGALCIALSCGPQSSSAVRIALGVTLLGLVLHAWAALPGINAGHEWVLNWLGEGEIELRFVHDGLSLLFVMLTQVVVCIALICSRQQGIGSRAYFALILTLQSALFGVFISRHFLAWFLFWEMTLIPSWLLIRMWGSPAAPKAALRFFIMTLAGSAFMLVGFLILQAACGTMDFVALGEKAAKHEIAPAVSALLGSWAGQGGMPLIWVALAVFLGLAVKLPVVPFHAWLPGAYAEAPTPVTMLLTGLLSKMGVYGLLRMFLPIFSEALPSLAGLLAGLAVATVLLGALAALAQRDLKRMLAYSSVNHLGYCALAIAAVAGMEGGRAAMSSALSGLVLQAINHGIIATGLFYGISILEARSHGKRGLDDFGGLRAKVPVFCGLYGIVIFASLGLPGLGGFIGEFLIFNGSFALMPLAAAISVIGLLLTAVFLLRMIRKVFAGPLPESLAKWSDLNGGERLIFGVLVAIILLAGICPQLLLQYANPAIVSLLDLFSNVP